MKRIMPATSESYSRIALLAVLGMLLIIPALNAQSGKGKKAASKSEVLAKIGKYNLMLDEFEQQYIRNNGGETVAARSGKDERKDFLELLIKYRLKVLEAHSKGYDKDPEIINELQEYRNSLAIPYFTERALVDPKIHELYELQKEEIRAAHILIRVVNDSLGNPDSLSALEKANDVLRQAREGVPFDSLATRYSDDRNTSAKGGDLLYFTAGMTLPAFDRAVYTLHNPGELYPTPVRTMFGYHIVKLLERHPSRGELQFSHILVRIGDEATDDSLAALKKINSIIDSMKQGVSFSDLAMRNSEDPGSASKGGDLGWVSRKRFVPEFELPAFELKEGELSRPVRTQFGYHLIYMTGERPVRPFIDTRQELKELYRRYSYDEDNAAFLNEIYARNNINLKKDVIAKILSVVDTTATTSAPGWYNKITKKLKAETVATFKNGKVTIDDAIRIIERNQDLQSKPLTSGSLNEVMELVAQKEVLRSETADLETRYPEFGTLMSEYQEGVLLFKAEQDVVWNQVKIDEESLKAFWEKRRTDYNWPDRVHFSEIFVSNDSLATVLRDSLDKGVPFEDLAERHTERAGFNKKGGDWGFQPVDANELSQRANSMKDGWVDGPVKFQYGYSLVKRVGEDKAREKTFEEAHSEVSSKFQEYESKRLESEWIEGLKKKFGVSIDEAVLDKAFSTLSPGTE